MKKNLVVICLDTLRRDMIHHMGVDFIQTPNLDAFARQSILFENAYGEGLPTIQFRRAAMTGIRTFPWRFGEDTRGLYGKGMGWHKVPPEHTLLSEYLVRQGYATGLYADTYHLFKPTMNFQRGFIAWEAIRGLEGDCYQTGNFRKLDLSRHCLHPEDIYGNHFAYQYAWNMRKRRGEEDWTTAQVFTKASEFLEDNADNQPFFLWIDSFHPHEPFDPPKEYADLYYRNDAVRDIWFAGHNKGMSEEETQRCKALYYGLVTFVDKWVGRFLDRLKALGLEENTIVAVVSDHGTELGEHGKLGKSPGNLYNAVTNLVFMLKVPGSGYEDHRVKAFVQDHDYLPTFMNLLGLPYDSQVEGVDLWPLVEGKVNSIRDHIIGGWGPEAFVRDEQWSYLANWNTMKHEALFHYPDDPTEQKDVAADHPQVVQIMRERLERFFAEPLPVVSREMLLDEIYLPRMFMMNRYGPSRTEVVRSGER